MMQVNIFCVEAWKQKLLGLTTRWQIYEHNKSIHLEVSKKERFL
jgi:hypothetical protein